MGNQFKRAVLCQWRHRRRQRLRHQHRKFELRRIARSQPVEPLHVAVMIVFFPQRAGLRRVSPMGV
jgi:hypothetical protein